VLRNPSVRIVPSLRHPVANATNRLADRRRPPKRRESLQSLRCIVILCSGLSRLRSSLGSLSACPGTRRCGVVRRQWMSGPCWCCPLTTTDRDRTQPISSKVCTRLCTPSCLVYAHCVFCRERLQRTTRP